MTFDEDLPDSYGEVEKERGAGVPDGAAEDETAQDFAAYGLGQRPLFLAQEIGDEVAQAMKGGAGREIARQEQSQEAVFAQFEPEFLTLHKQLWMEINRAHEMFDGEHITNDPEDLDRLFQHYEYLRNRSPGRQTDWGPFNALPAPEFFRKTLVPTLRRLAFFKTPEQLKTLLNHAFSALRHLLIADRSPNRCKTPSNFAKYFFKSEDGQNYPSSEDCQFEWACKKYGSDMAQAVALCQGREVDDSGRGGYNPCSRYIIENIFDPVCAALPDAEDRKLAAETFIKYGGAHHSSAFFHVLPKVVEILLRHEDKSGRMVRDFLRIAVAAPYISISDMASSHNATPLCPAFPIVDPYGALVEMKNLDRIQPETMRQAAIEFVHAVLSSTDDRYNEGLAVSFQSTKNGGPIEGFSVQDFIEGKREKGATDDEIIRRLNIPKDYSFFSKNALGVVENYSVIDDHFPGGFRAFADYCKELGQCSVGNLLQCYYEPYGEQKSDRRMLVFCNDHIEEYLRAGSEFVAALGDKIGAFYFNYAHRGHGLFASMDMPDGYKTFRAGIARAIDIGRKIQNHASDLPINDGEVDSFQLVAVRSFVDTNGLPGSAEYIAALEHMAHTLLTRRQNDFRGLFGAPPGIGSRGMYGDFQLMHNYAQNAGDQFDRSRNGRPLDDCDGNDEQLTCEKKPPASATFPFMQEAEIALACDDWEVYRRFQLAVKGWGVHRDVAALALCPHAYELDFLKSPIPEDQAMYLMEMLSAAWEAETDKNAGIGVFEEHLRSLRDLKKDSQLAAVFDTSMEEILQGKINETRALQARRLHILTCGSRLQVPENSLLRTGAPLTQAIVAAMTFRAAVSGGAALAPFVYDGSLGRGEIEDVRLLGSALERVQMDPAACRALMSGNENDEVKKALVAHNAEATLRKNLAVALPVVERLILAGRTNLLGCMGVGGKAHTLHSINEEDLRALVRDMFDVQCGEGFKLEHTAETVVLPPCMSAIELEMLIWLLANTGALKDKEPDLQFGLAVGDLPEEFVSIWGALKLLGTRGGVRYKKGAFSTEMHNGQTGARLFARGPVKKEGLPFDLGVSGRTDILGSHLAADAQLVQTVGTLLAHAHFGGPFQDIGNLVRKATEEILRNDPRGLDSQRRAARWVFGGNGEDTLEEHERMVAAFTDAWMDDVDKPGRGIVGRVQNLVRCAEAMMRMRKDEITRWRPRDYRRLLVE